MRAVVALLLAGCAQPSAHPAPDAPDMPVCLSAAGTANIVVRGIDPPKVYDRLYVGGFEGGLVNGVVEAPFDLRLAFASVSRISACCSGREAVCCDIDRVNVEVLNFPTSAGVGSHVADVSGTDFTATGTLTITDWLSPFDMMPGHVAGWLSVVTNTVTIDGMFDNTFCPEMVSRTI